MELLRLKAENMYSFPILDLDFTQYENGTTIILGKNLDMDSANGAGKTTILKVLYYALWGKELEGVPFSEVAFLKNKSKGFVVELLFREGDSLYKIIRSNSCKLDTKIIKMHDGSNPKGSSIEFLMDGEPFDVEADNALLKKYVEKKLGISPKIFLNSVLTAQKRKKNFLDSDDSNKKEDLSELLDLGFYDKAKKLVDEDCTLKEERLDKNKQRLSLANNSIDELKKSIESLLESSKNYKTNKKEKVQNLKNQKELVEKTILDLNKMISKTVIVDEKEEKTIKSSISNLENELKILEKDISNESRLIEMKSKEENIIIQSKGKIESLNKRNKEINKKKELYNTNITNLGKNVKDMPEDKILALTKESNSLKESILKMKKSKEEFNTVNLEFEKLKKDYETKESETNDLSLIIEKFKKENKCFTCERPFLEDENEKQKKLIEKKEKEHSILINGLKIIQESLSKKEIKLKKLNNDFKNLNKSESDLIKINEELSLLNVENEKQKSIIDKITFFKQEISNINNEIDSNSSTINEEEKKKEDAEKNLQKVIPYFEKLSKIKDKYNKTKINLKEEQEKLNKLIQESSEYRISKEKLQSAEKELSSINKNIELLKEEKDPYRKMINDNQDKIKNYNKEKEKIEGLIKEGETELNYLKFWLKGFSKTGIKSFETEEVINYLNERVQYHLEILSEGMQSLIFEPEKTAKTTGSVSNSIHTRFFLNGEERPKASLSGGEYQRLILATDLALSDVAENKSNSNFNIKFLDEPFDGIDSNGQIKALALFNNLSEERKGFFIISHDKEMQSFCDNAIYILKENGTSKLVDKATFLNAGNE